MKEQKSIREIKNKEENKSTLSPLTENELQSTFGGGWAVAIINGQRVLVRTGS